MTFETGSNRGLASVVRVLSLTIWLLASPSAAVGGATTPAIAEPLGGQPPAGSLPSPDLNAAVARQRAFEIVLWAMPAVSIYRFRAAAISDLGLKNNDIIAMSGPATPKTEALTANGTTPYISAFTDLKPGPVVLELPAAGADGSLYGQVVDAWQLTIADVGPSGLDAGKGGKYLFTAPGYSGPVPAGYIHVASPNNRIALAFRSIPASGKTADDAYAYAKRLRMYYLSEAGNPPTQTFFDALSTRYPTLPFYDERYFKDVYDIVTYEPVRPEDKMAMGMMSSLGIEAGKPFSPDATVRAAMKQAATDAWHYLHKYLDAWAGKEAFWPDRHYAPLLLSDRNREFAFVYSDRMDIDARAAEYFWCTYMPRKLTEKPATWYLAALADKSGDPLKPGVSYKVVVPKDMPAAQFWALTVYDKATNAFIYTVENRTTLSSFDIGKMKGNADGSVTLYVGPTPPAGLEGNWIPTGGKAPLPMFRYYGATDALYSRTFKMPDFEPAN